MNDVSFLKSCVTIFQQNELNLVVLKFVNIMNEKDNNTNPVVPTPDPEIKINFPDYPLYPVDEDIYHKGQKEDNIDPENIFKMKEVTEENSVESISEKNKHDVIGDLDIPGSELDDQQEDIGSEDEENNYYSLGGDNHNDLDEDKGE